jgi:phosphate transport system substrate-binding protein
MRKQILLLSTLTLLAASARAEKLQVDPAITAYAPVSGVSGNLNSIGSDTLNNLMTLWAEGFNS